MREQLQERGKPHLSLSPKYALGDTKLWEMYMRGQLKKESEVLSSALYDMMLFEPEKANDLYHALMTLILLTRLRPESSCHKEIQKWKAEQEEKAQAKQLVSQEDWKKAQEMIQRLKDCGLYDKRFAGGKYQVEFNVDYDGIPLKGSSTAFRTTSSWTQSLRARSASSSGT